MKKIIIAILISICFENSASAQDLFNVTEKDQDDNWHDKSGKAKQDYINNRIADINSILLVEILTDNIVNASNQSKGLPVNLSLKITAIRAALVKQKEVLDEINTIVKSLNYNEPNLQILTEQIQKIQPLAKIVDDVAKIDYRIEDLAEQMSNGSDDMYSSNYKAAAEVLKILESELKNYIKDDGIKIKFGAWLITKNKNIPLHIDGFDSIAPQERYEVERWVLTLTAAQKEELAELQKYAKANRDKGLDIFKEIANVQISALRKIVLNEYKIIADQITTEVNKLGTNANVSGIVAKAKDLSKSILDFKSEAAIRISSYTTIPSEERDLTLFLSKITEDVAYFSAAIKKLETDALDLKSSISSATETLPLTTKATIDNVATILSKKFTEIKNINIGTISDLINGRKLDLAALQFSNAVLKLSLADAKKQFEFDLANAGYREEGDRIAFKMSIYTTNDEIPAREQVREIYLFKVLTHVISTVGIVFADPFTSTSIQTQFQMAPYYNLLLKGWIDKKRRRQSISYNKIFDWGVGLHVSAPDFDKDDVPELGVGVVLSAIHDYLQSGIAYNIFTGDPYWFFGLRIPMPTFGSNNP